MTHDEPAARANTPEPPSAVASDGREPAAAAGPHMRIVFDILSLAAPLLLLLQGITHRLPVYLEMPVNHDVWGWMNNARDATSLYTAGNREPLHALMLRLGMSIWGDTTRATLLTTAVMTALLVITTWWLARLLSGRAAAFAVALVLATCSTVQHYALSGMREPLQTALGVACAATAVFLVQRPSSRRLLAAAIVIAALCLTRRYSALLGFGALGAALFLVARTQWRPTARWLAGCALLAGVLVLPRAFVGGGHGGADLGWFIEQNRATLGVDPGLPPPLSLIGALFEGRNIIDVVALLVGNLLSYFVDYLSFMLRDLGWAWAVCVVGLVASVFLGRGFLALCFLFAVAPFLPLFHLNPQAGAEGIEIRFAVSGLPFAVLAGADVLRRSLRWLVARSGLPPQLDEYFQPIGTPALPTTNSAAELGT